MSVHRPSCMQRLLIMLFCVQIAAGPAAANEMRNGAASAGNEPNFRPPSATDCARPAQAAQISGVSIDPAFGSRTLTLIDGRRVVSTSGSPAAVDLSTIPPNLLNRMDAVTGAGTGELAEAMVSGTRIQVPAGATSTNPIESITAEDMRRLGIVNAADALLHLAPAPAAAATSASAAATSISIRPTAEPVTAGMVDDNADFSAYLAFRNRTEVVHRERDISMRHLLQVRDARGAVVPDAEVTVQAASGAAMWARTDAGGQVWLHPLAFDARRSHLYEVTVRKNGSKGTAILQRGQKSALEVAMRNPGPAPERARLDLVFLIDATGSMADEIAKLKGTLRTIADEVARLPSRPDTCFGLVAYRDVGDQFFVRRHDFTNDLDGFQGVLDALQAGGGGDYAEAMNEALAETVHNLGWRGTDTTRLVVLLADAPPHLDYNGPQYDDSMIAALGKGIKVFSVGASGLDKQGEFIQRQIAQYTGGRFVFLTYANAANPASGPGRETVHDVNNYSVQTLDRLIVRLVTEELARLPTGR